MAVVFCCLGLCWPARESVCLDRWRLSRCAVCTHIAIFYTILSSPLHSTTFRSAPPGGPQTTLFINTYNGHRIRLPQEHSTTLWLDFIRSAPSAPSKLIKLLRTSSQLPPSTSQHPKPNTSGFPRYSSLFKCNLSLSASPGALLLCNYAAGQSLAFNIVLAAATLVWLAPPFARMPLSAPTRLHLIECKCFFNESFMDLFSSEWWSELCNYLHF